MGDAPPKNLVLILARELASNVSVPMFVVDREGALLYFNEPAEAVLGARFADVGSMRMGEWGTQWEPREPDGHPIPVERLPLVVAITERRPAHRPMRITHPDGSEADIAVTAFPLFAQREEFVGALAIFWDES